MRERERMIFYCKKGQRERFIGKTAVTGLIEVYEEEEEEKKKKKAYEVVPSFTKKESIFYALMNNTHRRPWSLYYKLYA